MANPLFLHYGMAILFLTFSPHACHLSEWSTCNLYNFGTKAGQACEVEWWRETNVLHRIKFRPTISRLIQPLLSRLFGDEIQRIEQSLDSTFGANTQERVVETLFTLEPYLAFVFADLLDGFQFTPEELHQIGLDSNIIVSNVHKQLYRNYFDLYCQLNLVAPFSNCINSWMARHCTIQAFPSYVDDRLNRLTSYYCNANQTYRASILGMLDDDLGSVYLSAVKMLGIVKDESPAAAGQLKLLPDSLLGSGRAMMSLHHQYQSECLAVIQISMSDISLLVAQSSEIGVGNSLLMIHKMLERITHCILRVWNRSKPSFFERNVDLVRHLQFLANRYSIDVQWAEIDMSSPPANLMLFGATHVANRSSSRSHDAATLTCFLPGQHSILGNRHYALRTHGQQIYPGFTIINAVAIDFFDANVTYTTTSEYDELENTLVTSNGNSTNVNQISLSVMNNTVTIVDNLTNSKFIIAKFSYTLLLTVSLPRDLLDSSVGSLAIGCNRYADVKGLLNKIEAAPSAANHKLFECEEVCQSLEEMHRAKDLCAVDCLTIIVEQESNASKTRDLYELVRMMNRLAGDDADASLSKSFTLASTQTTEGYTVTTLGIEKTTPATTLRPIEPSTTRRTTPAPTLMIPAVELTSTRKTTPKLMSSVVASTSTTLSNATTIDKSTTATTAVTAVHFTTEPKTLTTPSKNYTGASKAADLLSHEETITAVHAAATKETKTKHSANYTSAATGLCFPRCYIWLIITGYCTGLLQ